MKKYNVVTGWNRGGTSVLILALKQSGIPIVGFKYPFQFNFDYIDLATKKRTKQRKKQDGGLLLPLEAYIGGNNPNGFWEVPSICLQEGLQKRHKNIGFDGDLIKVPSRVFPSCNPKLVDKVIVILRNPRKVLTSQMKTGRVKKKNRKKYVKVGALGMLYNMLLTFRWIKRNKKHHLLLYYEHLLESPKKVLHNVCKFLGRGESKFGARMIDKKLDRSKPVKSKCKELKTVIEFYNYAPLIWQNYDPKKIKGRIIELEKKGEKITNL